MTSLKAWKVLQSDIVLDHPWCHVRQDQVELTNGTIINDFFVHVRPDVALVLPITSQQEIVFVRQYRHGAARILLELPAGNFNPDQEDPAIAAARELLEETGYVAQTLQPLAKLHNNPVKDTSQIHLFLAEGVSLQKQQELDITEEIEVVLVPVAEVFAKIHNGEICVAGTIAAIFLGLNQLQQRDNCQRSLQ